MFDLARSAIRSGVYRALGRDVSHRVEQIGALERASASAIEEFQFHRLKIICFEAIRHSLYKVDSGQRLPTRADIASARSAREILGMFPIMTKARLQQYGSSKEFPVRMRGATYTETTGTTGQVTKVWIDPAAHAQKLAAREVVQGWFGVRRGDFELRLWGRRRVRNVESVLKDLALGRQTIDMALTAPEVVSAVTSVMRKYRRYYVYGYSSLVLRCAALLLDAGVRSSVRPAAVFCTAEELLSHERNRLAQQFGCPVAVEYGCSEVDLIAHECPGGHLHVISPNVIVEAVENNWGTSSVVVTDLWNVVQPIVRYALQDEIARPPSQSPCVWSWPVIGSVAGRTSNRMVKLGNGTTRHCVAFAYAFETLARWGILFERFLVVQVAVDRFDVIVEGGDDALLERLQLSLNGLLEEQFGWPVQAIARRGIVPLNVDRKRSYFVALDD